MGTLTGVIICGMLEPENRRTGPSQVLSMAESLASPYSQEAQCSAQVVGDCLLCSLEPPYPWLCHAGDPQFSREEGF